jgi:chromosome partitioning protein
MSEDWDTIKEKLPDAVDDMIWETEEGPDLIPAHEGLDQADDELASVPVPERYQFIDRFLTEDVTGYDIVLIDLPGLTNNITINGLWATRRVVAPVELGPFEEKQMGILLEDLDEISETFDMDISVTMVLPNRVDSRTKLSDELLADLSDEYSDSIAPDHIPQSQDIKNAQQDGKTVFSLDEPSATAERARDAYQVDAIELINRLES